MKCPARLSDYPHAVRPRRLYPFVALVLLFVLSTEPTFAGVHWCSRDPVLTFSRLTATGGTATEHVLDVQAAVATGAILPSGAPVTLDVRVPANVTGTDLLAPVTAPLFNVYTSFSPTLPVASSEAYTVFLDASYPASVDADLLITGAPLDGFLSGTLQVTCEGQTARNIRVKVSFAPLQVACQQAGRWVVVFG